MKSFTVFLTLFTCLMFIGLVSAQTVSVTFHGNTSTVTGFTDSTDVIQIRGGIHEVGHAAPPNDWNQEVLIWGSESPEMTNTGGDYWIAVIEFPTSFVGDTVEWKFGATRTDADGNESDWWEDWGNKQFILPGNDTTIAMSYLSHGFDPPYTPSDSIDVYFRLNMVANPDFNPDTDTLSIVGDLKSPTMPGERMWSPGTYKLTRESATSDYWYYHYKVDSTSDAYPSNGTKDSTYYRFAIGSGWDNTENIQGHGMFPNNENRGIVIKNDTTVAWKYWNDSPPGKAGDDSAQVKFRVNLVNAIAANGFSIGDTLEVRYGYEGSARYGQDTLINEFGTNFYSITVKINDISTEVPLIYQYYSTLNGSDEREIYFDFDDPGGRAAERRKVNLTAVWPTVVEVQDIVDSKDDARRMPLFRNTAPLENPVTVTWECDLRPAYYQVKLKGSTLMDIQGETHIGPEQLDSIFVWGVWMNGPAVGDWSNPSGSEWGSGLRANPDKMMWDDGTNGDMVAGDSIYSRTTFYSPDSQDVIGQIYKFGINGGDNEAGGAGFGNNHVANIDDESSTFTIHTQFGSINPPFYTAWDFEEGTVSDIEDVTGIVIRRPNLRRNYPNPFNPSTTLTFELPKQMKIKLVIYDVLGRVVNTLVDGPQKPGVHSVIWSGKDNHGSPVSSGVYFYSLTTDNYNRTLKMVLLR